jgi:hypothetical protein
MQDSFNMGLLLFHCSNGVVLLVYKDYKFHHN